MKDLRLLIFAVGFGSGCSTIQFSEIDSYQEAATMDIWHSNVGLGFVEWSDPIDLNASCRNKKLHSFTIEETAGAALLRGATFYLWTPLDVSIYCR